MWRNKPRGGNYSQKWPMKQRKNKKVSMQFTEDFPKPLRQQGGPGAC